MTSFVSKPILTSQTIGEQLKKAREGAGLSLRDISVRLNIRGHYLNSIELGMYSEMPGEVYTIEFIKKYAQILRMDSKKAVQIYKTERSGDVNVNNNFGLPAYSQYKFKWHRLWIGRLILAAGSISAFAYVLFLGFSFFSAPTIEITTPAQYFETNDSRIAVQGQAKSAREVYLNGQPLVISKDGSFSESYSLSLGLHLLKITAIGRFGKHASVYRVVVIKPNQSESLVFYDY